MEWKSVKRPGFFGRNRDIIVDQYNISYGVDKWRLVWVTLTQTLTFKEACIQFYEQSYLEYLRDNQDILNWICSFGEVIDNAPSNISSGFDYEKQESYSTHIQDIAIRNVLRILGRKFNGGPNYILTVRGLNSNGHHLNPGQIPFYDHNLITQPSKAPYWALKNSVEDFWQSNKWLQVLEDSSQKNLPYTDGK